MSIKQAWCNFCCTEPVFRWTFLEEVYSPPRGGRRRIPTHSICRVYFNPRPLRGGRHCPISHFNAYQYFNPRPPRGGRPTALSTSQESQLFQSTPSAGRATLDVAHCKCEVKKFQSTPSAGRATTHALVRFDRRQISIHALRGEGDKRVMIRFLPGSSP